MMHPTPVERCHCVDCCEHRRRQHLPLSIRRFMDRYKSRCPFQAMSRAVEALVRRHDELNPHTKGRWDLESLCDAVDVSLVRADKEVSPRARIRLRCGAVKLFYRGDLRTRETQTVVGHELGHLLIHAGHVGTRLFEEIDKATVRIGTSAEEEALAEYCGQLLWRMAWRVDEAEKERSRDEQP